MIEQVGKRFTDPFDGPKSLLAGQAISHAEGARSDTTSSYGGRTSHPQDRKIDGTTPAKQKAIGSVSKALALADARTLSFDGQRRETHMMKSAEKVNQGSPWRHHEAGFGATA